MTYTRVAKVFDVGPGSAIRVEAGGREIVLCNVGGELYAVDEYCSHAEGSLSEGYFEGYEVECPVHGARFDVRTGGVTAEPAVVPVDAFPVRVVGDDIEVDV